MPHLPWRVGTSVLAAVLIASAGTADAATTSARYGVQGGNAAPSLQRQVGSGWTVVSMPWPAGEPTPGHFDFSKFDSQVSAQEAVGVQTEFRVQTCAVTATGSAFWGTYPLPWGVKARPSGPCTQEVPRSQSAWGTFISQLVSHYKTFAHPVTNFAINNEVNDPGQWPGISGRTACSMSSCPVFDDYITTLATAYKAAHAANPAVVVLDAGLSSPTLGVATTRAKYEAGGKTATALKAAIQYLDQYFAYRHPPGNAPTYEYIDPNQTTAKLQSQFVATFYGTATPQADRFYYFATHEYAQGSMDAIQMHFYDYAPDIATVLSFMHSNGGVGKPVYCWECGQKWPAKNGQLYNFSASLAVSFLQQKAQLGFANGMVQLIWLPMTWSSPPAKTDIEKDLPLVCGSSTGSAYAPGLCGAGSTLSALGVEFRKLATGT